VNANNPHFQRLHNPHFQQRLRSAYELSHLLRKLPDHFDLASGGASAEMRQQMEAAETHADNYSEILLDGLESLGRVMWSAAENKDWPVEQQDVARLGTLISQLAVQLQFIDEFRTSVNYEIAQANEKDAFK
jgi:hypothetical protein